MLLDQRQRLAQRVAHLDREQARNRPALAADDVPRPRHGRVEQVIVPHPLVVVYLGEVALAGVREQHDDEVLGGERPRHFERHPHRHPGRSADEDGLLAREAPREVEPGAVGAGDDLVDDREVGRAGDEILPHAFDLVGVRLGDLAGFVVGLEDRAHRVGADDAHLGIALLQAARDPADRPAGSQPGDEVRQLARGLLPDLGPGALVVGQWVGRIVILVGEERSRPLLGDALGHRVVRVGRVRRHRGGAQQHLGAVCLEQVHLLARDLVRHAEHGAVAAHRRHHRQTDAGVARGAFDDRAPGFEQALALGGLDHREADTVLDAAPGVEELELGEYRGRTVAGDLAQAHERGASHGVEHRLLVAHTLEDTAHGDGLLGRSIEDDARGGR